MTIQEIVDEFKTSIKVRVPELGSLEVIEAPFDPERVSIRTPAVLISIVEQSAPTLEGEDLVVPLGVVFFVVCKEAPGAGRTINVANLATILNVLIWEKGWTRPDWQHRQTVRAIGTPKTKQAGVGLMGVWFDYPFQIQRDALTREIVWLGYNPDHTQLPYEDYVQIGGIDEIPQ